MRTYPTNSPEAAARIIALAMLADGHFCKTEMDMLVSVGAHSQLGLTQKQFHAVIQTLCEDLLATSYGDWESACRVGPDTFASLMAEIDDAELRATVLRLCAVVIAADEQVTENESRILAAALDEWRQPYNPLAPGDFSLDSRRV